MWRGPFRPRKMSTVRRVAAVLVVFLGATLVAQTPARDRASLTHPTGTSSIRGRVVTLATGDPIRHAVMKVSGGSGTIPPVLSDEEGRFQFMALPAGKFTVAGVKPGFAKTSVAVDVAAGDSAVAPDLAMP